VGAKEELPRRFSHGSSHGFGLKGKQEVVEVVALTVGRAG
jgi:hypothetical protein